MSRRRRRERGVSFQTLQLMTLYQSETGWTCCWAGFALGWNSSWIFVVLQFKLDFCCFAENRPFSTCFLEGNLLIQNLIP